MASTFFLTDEPADLSGYLRAKLGSKSDAPSLVRSVTDTAAGPSSGIQITRTAAGTALAWITDPLSGVDLTAAAWIFHVWAKESALAANAALRFQVLPFSNVEATAALDDNNGTELTATMADYARTTGVATVTALAAGDRLVFKILVDDAGTMAASQTVTVAYNGFYGGAEGDSYITCPDTLVLNQPDPPSASLTIVKGNLKIASTNAILSDAELNQAIVDAVASYSKDRPRRAIYQMTGDNSSFTYPLPPRWVQGFSSLKAIEYPTDEDPSVYLDENDYGIQESVLGLQPTLKLRFRSLAPSGTANLVYTTKHSHTAALDTIPSSELEPVLWLATSYAARKMEGKQAGTGDSTITADSVNYRDGVQRWRDVARDYERLYNDWLGGAAMTGAAQAFVDWDVNLTGGMDRLWHGRRWR